MSKLLKYVPGTDMTEEEFNETVQDLIDKSLAEKTVVDDIEYVRLTAFGEVVSQHLDSDPSMKN